MAVRTYAQRQVTQASFAEADAVPGPKAARLLAIALVLDGVGRRTDAAEICGMDRQTLRDWAHRYNAEGVSGLFNRRPPDRTLLLSAAQKEQLAEVVRGRPDPAKPTGLCAGGALIWRKIEERFGVISHRANCRAQLARRWAFADLSARPQHPKSDPDAGGF